MKRGTARIGNESIAVKSLCTTTTTGVELPSVRAIILDAARTTQIGKPRTAKIANEINK